MLNARHRQAHKRFWEVTIWSVCAQKWAASCLMTLPAFQDERRAFLNVGSKNAATQEISSM
jgi:hypothetical protein